jgi:hypothetical protein
MCSVSAEGDSPFKYQDKVAFSATKNEIKEAFPWLDFNEKESSLTANMLISRYECSVSFLMLRDSLMSISVTYESKKDYKDAYEIFKNGLLEKYGDGTEDKTECIKMFENPASYGLKESKFEPEEYICWILEDVEITLFQQKKKAAIIYSIPNLFETIDSTGF